MRRKRRRNRAPDVLDLLTEEFANNCDRTGLLTLVEAARQELVAARGTIGHLRKDLDEANDCLQRLAKTGEPTLEQLLELVPETWELWVVNNDSTDYVWQARWSNYPGDPTYDARRPDRTDAIRAATVACLEAQEDSVKCEDCGKLVTWDDSGEWQGCECRLDGTP